MNLRCSYCQTPFTLGRMDKLNALQHMELEKLTHFDVYCPRCRRATPVQRTKMELTIPKWRDSLKELEAEMKAHPQQEAPLPKAEADSEQKAESKPKPVAKAEPKAEKKPAAKLAAKKPSPKAKTVTKKKK